MQTRPSHQSMPPSSSLASPFIYLPSTSDLTTSYQPHDHGRLFNNAHDFIINNSQITNNVHAGPGLRTLLSKSMPDAFHDSGARYPPPKCHLGTRNDCMTKIMNWALGEPGSIEPVLWISGPFGVGKSAVAQSFAEALEPQQKLAATLFFSRSSTSRNDPHRVFTSIAYQIVAKCRSFREIVSMRMYEDPALATRSLSKQFEDLIISPLREIDIVSSGLCGRVIIIDGLDECRGTAEQCEIINTIATSVWNQTTPFRWFITSRPEGPIIRTMKSDLVAPVVSHCELPVSREIDNEILLYLTDEFGKIRKQHDLPDTWPSEEALALLVERGAGLWIYVATIVRFVKEDRSFGPQDQLRIVLEFAKDVSVRAGSNNPLEEMDFFYTLIMQRLPSNIRTIVRKILLINPLHAVYSLLNISFILSLSMDQIYRTCAFIQSIVELQASDHRGLTLRFYHASFLDFMKDPKRSKELCIFGSFLNECRRELLDRLHEFYLSRSILASDTIPPDHEDRLNRYEWTLECFWDLCAIPAQPLDTATATALELPIDLPCRDKILRKRKCPMSRCTRTEQIWILGDGEHKVIPEVDGRDQYFRLSNNENRPVGICYCGAKLASE
ncbi:hypothetical protein NP233_g2258 [Leucocoprinus birnbaumii]|uniref:Nephrocystin 3-like N-terminal domain-containing protein n=1 Tax=Leucocoprinus birnbaumii TaxID=56174 RepID=A0AAD5VYM0_9AGAR|nr:hypothetical protein NP233_g2258 [Leucocoprinus birnbaumii]